MKPSIANQTLVRAADNLSAASPPGARTSRPQQRAADGPLSISSNAPTSAHRHAPGRARGRIRRLVPVALLALAAPAPVFACAACYGKTDDAMAVGMNWAILTLGVIVATVLGAFLAFLIYAIRKSEAVEAARVQAAAAAKQKRVEQLV